MGYKLITEAIPGNGSTRRFEYCEFQFLKSAVKVDISMHYSLGYSILFYDTHGRTSRLIFDGVYVFCLFYNLM